MDNDRLHTIMTIFQKEKSLEILSPFKHIEKGGIMGTICLNSKNEALKFNVTIPLEYPLVNGEASTIFTCDQIEGYLHQVHGDKICIISPKTAILSEKLILEIDALKKWMLKYFINEEEDERYEYLMFKNYDKNLRTQLLFTSIEYTFQKHEYGIFKFAALIRKNDIPWVNNSIYEILYIQSINESFSHWAKRFHQQTAINLGLWFYIEKEPIVAPGLIVNQWEELLEYFSEKQIEFLTNNLKEQKLKNNGLIYVIIGYDISKTNIQNIHWQLIKLSTKVFLNKQKSYHTKNRLQRLSKQDIHWSNTKNCSYNRFFGRGKLSNYFTEKKILIIGIGAIGSSLATSLVRGGAKNICISDFDIVETGNICRSEYLLIQENTSKEFALINLLNSISPFVNVNTLTPPYIGIPKIRPLQLEDFKALSNVTSKFDIIFDCSTDMEIAYMFDNMELAADIFNISITNDAKELVVVNGKDIAEDKARIFNDLNSNEELIFEGEGCAFPTFKASYIDINSLLNYALKNLDYRVNKGIMNSFVIKSIETFNSIQFEIDEY